MRQWKPYASCNKANDLRFSFSSTENNHLYLIGGDFLCFTDATTSDSRRDVIDSMLFAEVVSDQNATSSYSANAWLNYYYTYTEFMGWLTTTLFPFYPPRYPYRVNTTQSYLHEIGQAAIHEMSQLIESTAYNEKLTKLIDVLNKAGSKELNLFARMHSRVRKDLMFVAISDYGQGFPTLALIALEISSIDLSNESKLLSPASQFDYKVTSYNAQLVTEAFDKIRKLIEKKIGDYLKHDVLPVR